MLLLDWLNKNQALRTAGRVPFRQLETVSLHGSADNDNWLTRGDNLEALKALLPFHAGRVKCIYIDPPYDLYQVEEKKIFDYLLNYQSTTNRLPAAPFTPRIQA